MLEARLEADMSGQGAMAQIDALLLPFLHAADEEESKRLFGQLVSSHADQIIREVIKCELKVSLSHTRGRYHDQNTVDIQDAKDIYGDVIEKLLRRLRNLKNSPGSETITNFRSYVAITAKNSCSDYLRRKHPQRWRLRNRLLYLLTHQEEFALWEEKEELLCGLATWLGQSRTFNPTKLLAGFVLPEKNVIHMNPADLLASVFKRVGAPIKLDDLIDLVANLYGIKERIYEEGRSRSEVTTKAAQCVYLEQLWKEICRLPLRQRAALLLNVRDESGYGIALFQYRGIATIRQIAEALNKPYEQLVSIWNDLPLDDATIAKDLGITRQQVINLRKAARERLAHHMETFYE